MQEHVQDETESLSAIRPELGLEEQLEAALTKAEDFRQRVRAAARDVDGSDGELPVRRAEAESEAMARGWQERHAINVDLDDGGFEHSVWWLGDAWVTLTWSSEGVALPIAKLANAIADACELCPLDVVDAMRERGSR